MNAEGQPATPPSSFLKWFFICLGMALALFILLLASARSVWLLQLPFHLCAGWILHGIKGVFHLWSNLGDFATAAALPAGAAVTALCGFHRLALWWRQATRRGGEWRFRHTALVGSLVLMGASAAIALSGVLHELVWLPQGQVITLNRNESWMEARSRGRMLGNSLSEYQEDHEKFPESLRDLENYAAKDEWSTQVSPFVRMGNNRPAEPFVLTVPARTMAALDDVVMISPQLPDKGHFIVVRADYSTSMMQPADFIKVVKAAHQANKEMK